MNKNKTVGKRHDLEEDDYSLEPGEYGRNLEGLWYCRVPAPDFYTGGINIHKVVEHEDGTITVTPSIVSFGKDDKQWHGYLIKGVWEEI